MGLVSGLGDGGEDVPASVVLMNFLYGFGGWCCLVSLSIWGEPMAIRCIILPPPSLQSRFLPGSGVSLVFLRIDFFRSGGGWGMCALLTVWVQYDFLGGI